MKRKNATRNALFTSIISLLLCVSMLVGTTFAWFTDTASTGINTITAGNLDIEVLYAYPSDVVDGEIPDTAWKVVDAQTPVFNKNALWEPGYTEVVYLKYVNKGSLSLQFQMHVDIINETEGTNVAGEKFHLSDYIEAYVCGAVDYQFEIYENREEALNPPYAPDVWHGSLKQVSNMAVATPDDPSTWLSLDTWNWLKPAEEYYTTLVLFMPTTVGNEANYKTGTTAPKIDLGINVIATQYNWENEVDSYDKDYDEGAEYPALLLSQSPITNAFEDANGTSISEKVANVIFGKTSEYPEIVNNYKAVSNENSVAAYQVPNGEMYDIYYLSESKIKLPAYSKNLFEGMKNMTAFDASNLDMSEVQNALGMFANCTNLETIEGTENWDMSNVTNMQSIFYGCNKLKDIDVSNWDTSNVTNMRMVFFRCYELDNATLMGVENWDVSNVKNFYSMFKHARGLTSLNLSDWDTSSATTMSHMFANIGGLEYLDLSSFDTSNVTDMSWMFYDASKLTTILVGDGWTTAAVTTTTQPFYNNQALVGGSGTTWLDVCDMANPARPWESSAKLQYAIVDGGTENPGLLTYKVIRPAADAEDLFDAAEEGGNIVITDDIVHENTNPDNQMILESENEINFDGNGNTITITGTDPSTGNHGYVEFVPPAGEDVTVRDLTITGSGFVGLGDYNQKAGKAVANNLKIVGLASSLSNNNGGDLVACAFMAYADEIELNNCVMKDTTSMVGGETKAYDAGFGNKTNTVINGGEYGTIRVWEHAFVTINNAEIGVIDSRALATSSKTLGKLTIGDGTHVGTINLIPGNYIPSIEIMDGATVDEIVYNGVTYTQEEWLAR